VTRAKLEVDALSRVSSYVEFTSRARFGLRICVKHYEDFTSMRPPLLENLITTLSVAILNQLEYTNGGKLEGLGRYLSLDYDYDLGFSCLPEGMFCQRCQFAYDLA
jgi:hypothetical protein